MIRLATVAGALLLAVGWAVGSHNGPGDVAIRRHHYFVVGKLECQRQLRHPHGLDSLVFVRTDTARYAKDLEAGCRAAAGF